MSQQVANMRKLCQQVMPKQQQSWRRLVKFLPQPWRLFPTSNCSCRRYPSAPASSISRGPRKNAFGAKPSWRSSWPMVHHGSIMGPSWVHHGYLASPDSHYLFMRSMSMVMFNAKVMLHANEHTTIGVTWCYPPRPPAFATF